MSISIAASPLHGCPHTAEKLRIPENVWIALSFCASGEGVEERVEPLNLSALHTKNDFENEMQVGQASIIGPRGNVPECF